MTQNRHTSREKIGPIGACISRFYLKTTRNHLYQLQYSHAQIKKYKSEDRI
jgi:hypothetical protein